MIEGVWINAAIKKSLDTEPIFKSSEACQISKKHLMASTLPELLRFHDK